MFRNDFLLILFLLSGFSLFAQESTVRQYFQDDGYSKVRNNHLSLCYQPIEQELGVNYEHTFNDNWGLTAGVSLINLNRMASIMDFDGNYLIFTTDALQSKAFLKYLLYPRIYFYDYFHMGVSVSLACAPKNNLGELTICYGYKFPIGKQFFADAELGLGVRVNFFTFEGSSYNAGMMATPIKLRFGYSF